MVRFLLDGKVMQVDNPDPTRTLLQYLREDLRRTGTKEGCAEGDCGACTVVVGELTPGGDDLDLKAVNACIRFLPTLDGKSLYTVESLSQAGEGLHPVQQAMVEQHGSQCGFCTPGFVMSLFAMYKSGDYSAASPPGRVAVDDALSGNLCRCTGYRPIVAAAQSMFSLAGDSEADWKRQPGRAAIPEKELDALRSIQRTDSLQIDTGDRRYFAPKSAAELATLLETHPNATLLAGGTDVGLWVTKQHRDLETVIYTGDVKELGRIADTGETLEIGAGVSLSDAIPAITMHFPAFGEMFRRFASPPIRNAATLGGNVANGSPIGDSMPALIVAGASVLLQSAGGQREIALETFYRDYMVNELADGEFVAAIRIPRPEQNTSYRCYKISKRFDQDISAVCAAFAIQLDGETIASARVAFGGMAATVRRAPECEAALKGNAWHKDTISKAAHALVDDFAPISDMRATSDYRIRVAQNLLERCYLDMRGEGAPTVYEYGRTG